MIRIVLLAGAAAAGVGVKKLQERKQRRQKAEAIDVSGAGESEEFGANVREELTAVSSENGGKVPEELNGIENGETHFKAQNGEAPGLVEGESKPKSETPKAQHSSESVVPDGASLPVAIPTSKVGEGPKLAEPSEPAKDGEGPNLAERSKPTRPVSRSRISRLRLEIEGASQVGGVLPPSPGPGGSLVNGPTGLAGRCEGIKATPTPFENGPIGLRGSLEGIQATPTLLENGPTGLEGSPEGIKATATPLGTGPPGPGEVSEGIKATRFPLENGSTGLEESLAGIKATPTPLENGPTGIEGSFEGIQATPTVLQNGPTGPGDSPKEIKATPTPLGNGPIVLAVADDAALAVPPPGGGTPVALPTPGTASVANADRPSLSRASSIRAPPTPSKEMPTPVLEEIRPLVISRAVPTIPVRSRSRGPRVSVNAGLLDILPEGDARGIPIRAAPSNRPPSVEPPPFRSSFTEGVFGALARSVPKIGLPLLSRSGPSSPVGSIHASPTPMAFPKQSNPNSHAASPAPSVVKAVPTPGAVVKDEQAWGSGSVDGGSESATSAGTNGDGASVIVSPIKTESQRRVARERLSLKDRWELDANASETTAAEGESISSPSFHSEARSSTVPSEDRRPHTEAPEDVSERKRIKTECKKNPMGQSGTGVEAPSRGAEVMHNGLERSGKALQELETEEKKRREVLRVLEEREAELKGRLAELERALEERRAANVAGLRGSGLNGKKEVGEFSEVGAVDRFDQANFDRWCQLRAGTSAATTHWYSSGELYSYPGGQLLARLEGFEAVRARIESPRLVHELSRRLVLFVDREKGTPLADAGGGRLGEIRTPYQHCAYRLEGSVVHTEVTVGSGPSAMRLGGTAGGVHVMQGADGVVFTRPTFLSIPSEKGDFLAYESQDYFTTRGGDAGPTDHFSMVRLGPVPGFPGQCFVHVVGWKVADLSALPRVLRDELDKEPLWKEAPEKVHK